MPEWVTWVFDGIGSTIFSIAVSALIGGAAVSYTHLTLPTICSV